MVGHNFCSDRNECLIENGGCHHVCLNTPGSHVCKCDKGYRLHTNSTACVGKKNYDDRIMMIDTIY